MQKVNSTIPVYDICSLNGEGPLHDDIIAVPFAHYLQLHTNLHFPHRHSFYHVVLFTEGAGTHTIDFERFPVQPEQIYFMIPGQVHTWDFEGHVDGFIINCSENLIHTFLPGEDMAIKMPFLRGIAKDSVYNLSGTDYEKVAGLMQNINEEVRQSDHFTRSMISVHLMELFITVCRVGGAQHTTGPAQQNNIILYNFRKIVNEMYRSKHLPKDYAELLYITPNHLNAVCNDLLGKSAGEVIRERILLEAKRLLINAGINIAEIAWQLGFSDNSYFTRFFKKYEGVPPEEFRRSFLNHSIKH